MNEKTGYLVLNTGDVLEGKWLGDGHPAEGEMVFNTAMTGYQEVMTDPSYAGQIVTMTYPLIGNYGFNDIDHESLKPSLAGLIISYPCHTPEHYQSTFSLQEMVTEFNIPTLYDIDTRALTRIIRENGEVYGKITEDQADFPKKQTVDPDIVKQVSVQQITPAQGKNHREVLSDAAPHVVVYDYGYKHSITHTLMELGCKVTVVPFDTDPEAVEALQPDGIVLSNGPGDPQNLAYLAEDIKALTNHYPTLGICLGHQLVALAHGGQTERLPYGHRGSNHPVKNLANGKVLITSQNHGYVVKMSVEEMEDWEVSYVNVNDRSVEGLVHRNKPVMTVQFHPEAHPGPIDTYNIFHEFVDSLSAKGEKKHA